MYLNQRIGLLSLLAANAWASSINWYTCKQNATVPVTCGSLNVPLDYTDKSSKKTLNLELLKVNATKEPCKGSILFNPGGPGDSTKEFIGKFGKEMLIATGGHYNLIAFEPRGLGSTIPFSCYKDPADRLAQESKIPTTTNASDTSLGYTWSAFTGLSQACYEMNKDTGSLLGTAFVARDMMQIVDALGEDGLLRYWGFSYGTVLGATVVSMFPDRMDKIVLDGVVNVPEWYKGSNDEEFLQADASLRAFFKDCLAAPDTCAIQAKGRTPDDLYNEFMQFLDTIKYEPLVLGSNLTTDFVEYATVKNLVLTGIKTGTPMGIPVAAFIDALLRKDAATFHKLLAALAANMGKGGSIYPNLGPEAAFGIQCGDVVERTNDLNKLKPQIDYYYKSSRFGGDSWGQLLLACAQWKMEAKERFTGPFKAKTKTPILFISSPFDPNTPMVSARNMSARFEGSVVLQQNGIGHCSIAQPGTCTIKATQAYFTDGKLPKHGTVCEPEFNFVSNHTILEIYELADKK